MRSDAWWPCTTAAVLQNTVCRYFYNGCTLCVQVSFAQAGAVFDLSCSCEALGLLQFLVLSELELTRHCLNVAFVPQTPWMLPSSHQLLHLDR